MILFIVALSLFLLSLVGILLVNNYIAKRGKKFGSTWMGPIFVVVLLVTIVFGLVALPLLRAYRVEYREIVNYQVLKSSDAIVIDLTNSNAKVSDLSNKLIKYNSYRAVTEFQDSTKIFERIERAFYGDVLYRTYAWSNPPYQFFNRE
jgi:energy-coupling factor transporter transmembrane protein EcfT